MAVTEPVGTNSFLNDGSQQLLNDGSSIADRLKAQFVTIINSSMHKSKSLFLLQSISYYYFIYSYHIIVY